MVVETNLRFRRSAAAVLAFQSAKGTVVNDLRISQGAVRCWTKSAEIPAAKVKSHPRWMNEKFAQNQADRVTIRDEIDGELVALATPESVKAFLQSNWGPFAGSPATSTLSSVINQYATLAWIENDVAGSTQNLIQLQDVWIFKLKIQLHRDDGRLFLYGHYASRNIPAITALNALGGAGIQITLTPMTPNDIRVYNVRNATFTRAPGGANVHLDFIELELTIDQGVQSEWTYDAKWDVRKRGKTRIFLRFVAKLDDTYWAIINNNRTGVFEQFQITAITDTGSPSTLTINLQNMDYVFKNIGHTVSGQILVEATGEAFLNAQPPETGLAQFTIS